MLIPYIIGGLAAGLLGFEVYRNHHKPISVKKAEEIAASQKAAMEKAMAAMGIHPARKDAKDIVAKQIKAAMPGWLHATGSGGTTPGPAKPRLVQGDPLNTQTGKTYYVTMSLSVPAFMASRDTIVQEAQNHGFVNVIASPTMPQGWPGSQTGDWYVKAQAARPSQFQRHKGVMTIVEGFEQ